ncbi:unnamed protein product [Dracunculus medinensis]|uniref:HELP domain-containing protein n=1 Tax=Dracunculus medinensis TaxID=318479 RepID=A0A0N4U4H0_DRAME|nr:unnamed protein product [Dracunculus medinensis]
MLNVGNASMHDRIYDLERKVESQENELVCFAFTYKACLRASTKDLLHRLTLLEQNSKLQVHEPNSVRLTRMAEIQSRIKNRSKRNSTLNDSSRILSHSISNLNSAHSDILTTKNRSILKPSAEFESRKSAKLEENTPSRSNSRIQLNLSNGMMFGERSSSTPLRKWLSNIDMKKNSSSNSIFSPMRSILSTKYGMRDPIYLPEQRLLQVFMKNKSILLAVPSHIRSIDLLHETEEPQLHPKLEWVHGYRGKDSRKNLHELPTGEIIYFTGAIVVLHNPDEGIQRFYTQHTSEIKCIAVHPNRLYIATGQTSRHTCQKKILREHRMPICSSVELDCILKSDQTQAHIRIWDSVTLQTIRTIGTADDVFQRGISCVSFSHVDDCSLLAAIDESYDHVLSVWNWERGIKVAEIKSANDQVFDCEFHPLLKGYLFSFGKSHLNFWHFDGVNLFKHPAVFEFKGRDKPKHVLSCCYTQSGLVATGDSNGTITLWDLKMRKTVKQVTKVHEGGVWALCQFSSTSIISGGKDRVINEWNDNDLSRINKSIMVDENAGTIRTLTRLSRDRILVGTSKNSILCGDMKAGFNYIHVGHWNELWTLSAHPDNSQYFTASIDGVIRFWDIYSKMSTSSIELEDGVTCADINVDGLIFAVGTVSGIWNVYQWSTKALVHSCKESSQPISYIRFSPSGTMIAIATREPNSYVSVLDWSNDSKFIRTNNTELESKIRVVDDAHEINNDEAHDIQWSSSRSIISFETACLLQQVPGIMATERSPDNNYIAIAINNGAIRFYSNPVTSILARYKEIFGHGEFVANIAFVGSKLISIGAKDQAIFQWKL